MNDSAPNGGDAQDLTGVERDLAVALESRRPSPTPTFRGSLARRIAALDPGYGHRPPKLWLHSGLMIGAGVLLILVGALIAI